MLRYLKKALCVVFVVLVLAASFPFDAFAFDPVSSAAIANAFAQAISAYGAANGVSIVFDVSSTNGIGENMHSLWARFREGQQTVDDYADLAYLMWPDLYKKVEDAASGAVVAINVASTFAEEFDNFYNWLLSGPAELVQVDNQYYEWSSSNIGPSAQSIPIISVSGAGVLVPFVVSSSRPSLNPNTWLYFGQYSSNSSWYAISYRNQMLSYPIYFAYVNDGSTYYHTLVVCSVSMGVNSANGSVATASSGGTSSANPSTLDSVTGLYYNYGYSSNGPKDPNPSIPVYSSLSSALNAFASNSNDRTALGVKAYGDSTTASFPDTADPNYDALNRAKDIPLNIPWDDTKYGDGTGTLTDAQTGAIAGDLDGVIERDKELALAGDNVTNPPNNDDPPSSDPDDYLVLGLEDVFPFCIPFDIYDFLSALAATPTPPHFTATLAFPAAVGGNQTIEIDFDNPTFNQLAQLLRTLELLAFIVGLALLTRSMFIRG